MSKMLFYHSKNNVQNNVKFVSLYHHVTIILYLIYVTFYKVNFFPVIFHDILQWSAIS